MQYKLPPAQNSYILPLYGRGVRNTSVYIKSTIRLRLSLNNRLLRWPSSLPSVSLHLRPGGRRHLTAYSRDGSQIAAVSLDRITD